MQQQRIRGGGTSTSPSRRRHHRRRQILNETVTSWLDRMIDRLNSNHRIDNHNNDKILAVLVGTSDGVGLGRAFGTLASGGASNNSCSLSDEILVGMESIWVTLPAGSGHHLRPLGLGGSDGDNSSSGNGAGACDSVKTVTAFYENCTLVHMHESPIVVTFLATPNANVGAIRAILPQLRKAMEPIRQSLMDNNTNTSSSSGIRE